MACPRDTKNIVGEVHLMEEDNEENEILVDANGLDIPPGEISVYKDPSGELVLVVHTDDVDSSSKPATNQPGCAVSEVADSATSHTATSVASENSPSRSSQHCAEVAEDQQSPPKTQHSEEDTGQVEDNEVEERCHSPPNENQPQQPTTSATIVTTVTAEEPAEDTIKAVPIVDEPMEVEGELGSGPLETMMDSNPTMAAQQASLLDEPTKSLHPRDEGTARDSLRLKEAQESLLSTVLDKPEGPNETARTSSVLPNTDGSLDDELCRFAEMPKSPEISQSSEADDTSLPSLNADVSPSTKDIEELSLDKDIGTPQAGTADSKNPTLESGENNNDVTTTPIAIKSSTETYPPTMKSIARESDPETAEKSEDDYLLQASQPVPRLDEDKAIALPGDSFAPILVSRKADEGRLANSSNRESMSRPEPKTTEVTPEDSDVVEMEIEEQSMNTALAGDPQQLSEADPIPLSVSETVDIVETQYESAAAALGCTEKPTQEEDVSAVASDHGEPMTGGEIEEPPKKKRGRPSKKQQQVEGDGRRASDGASGTAASAKAQSNRIGHEGNADNDIDDSIEPRRRSGRERQAKRYEDYIEDNWDEDGEDGEEGDGLTARERKELDKKLQKQRTVSGRIGHGNSRNAASWVKKCNIIVGETAAIDRSNFRSRKAEPVERIEQAPPRSSQAIIRYYLPKKIMEPDPPATHCRIMYRPQDTFGVDMAHKRKRGMQDDYTCKCQYWTSRINNYIRHLRDHCPFSKDFFSWDEGMLKEVTRGQKPASSKKAELKAMPPTLVGGLALSDGGIDIPGQHAHSHAKELKESVKSGAVDKMAGEPKDEGSTFAPAPRGKIRRALIAVDDRPMTGDEVGDATVSARLGFRKHDIVWADLGKGVHWPALVLSIRSRGLQGKARANTMQAKVYLVHDGEIRTLPIAKVDGFDSARRQNYLETGRGGRGALAVDHARAAQKADKFLRERVLGTNIDPVRFFCLGETKLIEDEESSSSSSDDDEGVTEEAQGGEGVGKAPQWALPEIEPLPVAVGGEQPKHNNGGSSSSGEMAQALHIVKKAKRRRKLNNNALVDFIVNGKVEPHLVGIYRGTVPSERHASFMSSDEARRTALKKSTSWGPVDDVGQQEAVFEYCEDLFQRSAGDSGGDPGAENGAEQLDKHTYAFEVFCPEAITKAISRLAVVDMETAAQIFLKGHEQSKQFSDIQELAAKEQELERAAQKAKEEAIEREREAKTAAAAAAEEEEMETTAVAESTAIVASSPPTAAEAMNEPGSSEVRIEQDPQNAPGDNEHDEDSAKPDENLNTGDVVREELERLGVDQKLLEVLDKE